MATWETVRRLASALPATEESTSYRQPCFRVAGKAFVNMSPHERGALVVRAEVDEKPLLIESRPDLYYETRHYAGYPALLVRLDAIEDDELRERVIDSWLMVAPRRLVDALQGDARDLGRTPDGTTF
jgi:hypothetical protein